MARLIKAVTESFSDMESWKEICDTFNEHKARNYSNFLDVRMIIICVVLQSEANLFRYAIETRQKLP